VNADTHADVAKYWAFISYSHRDSKIAKGVQRALETYRIPKRLVGKTTKSGIVPAALKPVFRDREEMEAGADLKASVREALQQSRYLIVVCSPNAAQSPWVNQEIIEFKKLNGESRVLALIVSGEPFASRIQGREEEECFPEALRFALTPEGEPKGEALEPLAADLRPQRDGKRMAILKLVAGMVGVGVDELVRRDAQRRARRLAYLASGAIAGMAVMAVLTVLAIQSRAEAQSQRAQAEDLVEFMLGDLRKKLDPVGRLDVLDSVGEKALSYYAKQDADGLDANALGRRSRAMHLIGEIRDKQGNLNEALAAFKSAADTTAELLSRTPHDGNRIFDHAQSVYWMGYIAWRRGEADAAETAFLKYRDLAQQLVRIDPNNADWRLETAYASENLGVVQLERWQIPEALRSFSAQKEIESDVARTRPDVVLEVAEADGWIAKALEASGDYEAAIHAQEDRLDVLRKSPDVAKNRLAQRNMANSNYELGRLELSLGKPETAEHYAQTSVEIAGSLVASDSANMRSLSELCFDQLYLAEIELALAKRDLARRDFNRSWENAQRLIASDPSSLMWQINLVGLALTQKFRIAKLDGSIYPTYEFDLFVAAIKAIELSGKRLNSDQIQIVALVELMLGDMLDHNGQHKEATRHWRSVAERLEPLADHENYPVLVLLARAKLRLDQIDEARALAARTKASIYRHPAYADLENELTHAAGQGRFNATHGRS
jgi:tetratricopeptide (TPR) repeat protein